MSDFVLDASVALAWRLSEETGARANRALRRLEREDAMVPQLWHQASWAIWRRTWRGGG